MVKTAATASALVVSDSSLLLLVVTVLLLHLPTILYIGKARICVRYGCLPFIRVLLSYGTT